MRGRKNSTLETEVGGTQDHLANWGGEQGRGRDGQTGKNDAEGEGFSGRMHPVNSTAVNRKDRREKKHEKTKIHETKDRQLPGWKVLKHNA